MILRQNTDITYINRKLNNHEVTPELVVNYYFM
jgi:hypothetical protein